MKSNLLSLLIVCVLAKAAAASEPLTLKLWPDGPPTAIVPKSEATAKLIQSYGGVGPHRISDVSDPTMTVFRPEKPNGTSVIVAPGGGFMFLSYAHEGTQVCDWLNSLGVTAVLLKYRTPTRDEKEMFELPVQDGERALGLVRKHAAEWKLDPKRVGLLGFSAGANLAGHVAWDRGSRTYPQKPDLDDPRGPDFLIFIYGGGFLDKDDKSKFRAGFSIPADAPPAFFLVAHDDSTAPVEAARLYLEYKQRDLSAEVHIFAKGGHGFGMRQDGKPINEWPQRCAEWLKSLGVLDAPAPGIGDKAEVGDKDRKQPATGEAVAAAAVADAPTPIAYWKLDDEGREARDSVGAHHGRIMGAISYEGRPGKALLFDRAQEDHVSIPHSPDFEIGTFTVSAWVWLTKEPTFSGILGTRAGGEFNFDMKVNADKVHGDIGDGTRWIDTAINFYKDDVGSNGQGGDLETRRWYLITFVVDNERKECRLYLDADRKKTIPFEGEPRLMRPGQTMRIGSTGNGEFMDGVIDEVRIWKHALTDQQVRSVFAL